MEISGKDISQRRAIPENRTANDNAFRQLGHIITQYGRDICDDPRRCEALLRDLCPECGREINLLIFSLRANIVEDLTKASDAIPKELLFRRLADRLYDEFGIADEFAWWAVETWASVLGMDVSGVRHLRKRVIRGDSPPDEAEGADIPASKYRLRNTPMTVSSAEYKQVFGLDEDQRPTAYVANEYEIRDDGTISDHATELSWRQSASPDILSYEGAEEYVQKLNRRKFAGHDDWRLPTTDELASLLEPEKQSNHLHIAPVFDRRLRWCWTSDRNASGGAWFVHFENGYIDWLYKGDLYVCAVRSCGESENG